MITAEQMLNTAKGPHLAMEETIQARLDAERENEKRLLAILEAAEAEMKPFEDRMKAARSVWCESLQRVKALELLQSIGKENV